MNIDNPMLIETFRSEQRRGMGKRSRRRRSLPHRRRRFRSRLPIRRRTNRYYDDSYSYYRPSYWYNYPYNYYYNDYPYYSTYTAPYTVPYTIPTVPTIPVKDKDTVEQKILTVPTPTKIVDGNIPYYLMFGTLIFVIVIMVLYFMAR